MYRLEYMYQCRRTVSFEAKKKFFPSFRFEWLREIKTADQHCYKFLLIHQKKFARLHVNLVINNVEIIACKLEFFLNSIIYFINQEISAEMERSIAIVSAPETDKITVHAKEPRLWIAAQDFSSEQAKYMRYGSNFASFRLQAKKFFKRNGRTLICTCTIQGRRGTGMCLQAIVCEVMMVLLVPFSNPHFCDFTILLRRFPI